MSDNRPSVGIYTLGCKVNQYESEAIAERCAALGLSLRAPNEVCDAYIINTCTVTAEADRKARQFIRRAMSHNPEAFIAVTGCLAQVSPQSVDAIDGVDYICGNTSKLSAADAVAALINSGKKRSKAEINVSQIFGAPFEQMSISHFGRTRACVKIEDGCESNCTYCIIPSARGQIRSKRPEQVIEEVRRLTDGGCREVVLTGIETASYGRDLENCDLGDLLYEIDKIEGIGRVRLGSLDPSLFKPRFIEKISGLRSLAPHFHISLQSGSDEVLRLMKRKYNSTMALTAMENIRQAIPSVMFTTDIIVGFPRESEQNFRETEQFIEQARFLSAHIFPYSKREGTVAAAMDGQISESIKKQRSASLIARQSNIKSKILADVISQAPIKKVLFETYSNGYAIGHTDNFLEVRLPCSAHPGHDLLPVALCESDGEYIYGKIVQPKGDCK